MWLEIFDSVGFSLLIVIGFIIIGLLLRMGGLIMEWLWESDD